MEFYNNPEARKFTLKADYFYLPLKKISDVFQGSQMPKKLVFTSWQLALDLG